MITVHLLGPCGPVDCPDPPNLGQGCYAYISRVAHPPLPPKATAEPYILPQGGRSFSHFYHKTVCNKSCLYHIWEVKWTLVSSPPRQRSCLGPSTPAPPGPGPLTTLSAVLRAAHEDQTYCPLRNPKAASRLWFPVSQGGTPRALCEPRASELIHPVTASLCPTWRAPCSMK